MSALRDFRTIERFRLEYAFVGLVILVFVLGAANLLGQTGLVTSFAAIFTYLAESSGNLRQRAGGMLAFAVFGFVQILLVALVGASGWPMLVLLFAVSFICSWMMGYGEQAALLGFVSNTWITVMPSLGVVDNLVASLVGFAVGSLVVIVVSTIPDMLRQSEPQSGQDDASLFEKRQYDLSTLLGLSLVRALAITLGGLIGFQFLLLNQLWIAMTVNLILPPALQTTFARGGYRAAGTVLGAMVGFLLVWLVGDNTALLLIIELIAAFLLLYTAKGFVYGVFVFFLTIFITAQIGHQGIDMVRFGVNERIIATFIGVGIAFVTMWILQYVVKRDSGACLGAAAQMPK